MLARLPKIEFVLEDKVDGRAVTPKTITLGQFNEFNKQVQDFLSGSQGLKVQDVTVNVEEGSYKLVTTLTVALAAALQNDLQALQRQDSLGDIDPKRAAIVQRWQERSKGNPDLRYAIRPHGIQADSIEIKNSTDFHVGDLEPWVKVEKYLFGTIVDLGGVKQANVHLRLEDTGQIVVIGANQGYLKDQKENNIYRKALVRVEADQHAKTGQMRNFRLLSFENYQPGFSEAALKRFTDAGRSAWRDVPDAAEWVRQLRGGK